MFLKQIVELNFEIIVSITCTILVPPNSASVFGIDTITSLSMITCNYK